MFADTFVSLKNLFKDMKLTDFVKNVLTCFDIRSAFNPKDEDDFSKLMNIDSFVSSVSEFESQNPGAGLSEYLESITLMSDIDNLGEDGFVTIATIHAVKGLEFKVVFVVGAEEGLFPSARSIGSNAGLEEERRLMYVAVTRAEEKLFVSYCSKRYIYGQTKFEMPSRFCKELGIVKKQKEEQKPVFEAKPSFAFGSFYKKQEEEPKKDVSIYHVGQMVEHPKYGEGKIVFITDDGLVGDIEFDGFGKKSLMLEIAPLEILED